MKLIAKGNGSWIVDIKESELEKLTGYYYHKKKFIVGHELQVDSLYNQLKSLVTHENEIKRIIHALKTAAGMLEKIDPVFYKEKGE